ncbi:gastrula zinc finger protein XlCGF26.1 [Sergentomyia squamirostris]
MELTGKCQACLEETCEESQISIYSDENLKDIFHDVTSIKIDREDGLPGVLCGKCHTRLLDAHQFRQMCAVSALKFHKILDNLVPKRTKNPLPLKKKKKPGRKSARKVKKKQIKKEFRSEEEELYSNSELHPTEYVSVELPEEHTKVLSPKREQNDDVDDSFHSFIDTSRENLEEGKIDEPEGIIIKPDPEEMPDSIREMQKSKPVAASDFSCYICKKVFLRKSGLTTHLTQVHMNTKASVCKICGKDCLRTPKLDVHMTEVHGITEGLSCKICGKTYKHRDSLLMHSRQMHGENGPVKKPRNVICEECGKAFPCRSTLLRHSYTHSGLRPFACTHCPRKFETKSKLKDHMMRHDGIKNHVCTICGLRKTTTNELKVHMNYHTKEKTHTCQHCSKIYTSITSLKRHVNLVHLGIKAYSCTTCGRAFGKVETLKHHEMTHTGEKPEVCNVCGKGFIQRVALKKHMQTHERHK